MTGSRTILPNGAKQSYLALRRPISPRSTGWEDAGPTIYGELHSDRWGDFKTFLRFYFEKGKITELAVGETSTVDRSMKCQSLEMVYCDRLPGRVS